ncbi:MAG: low temperature requirement protein A [Candidatus Promineifilaceae bacterium]
MANVTDTLNELLQRPNLRSGQKERHATWLELFLDLVFVVAVAQLGHLLSQDLSFSRLLVFVGLYFPIWYAWFHHTLYADRFDTDNFSHRFLTFAFMLGVVGLAANIPGVLIDTSIYFAASMVTIKLIMIVLYQRCVHIEVARPLAIRLSSIFLISGTLWLISIFVPTPWRFWLWAAAVVFEFAAVFHRSTRMKYAVLPLTESHVVERWGLFTIIVLGESVAAIVNGASESGFQIQTALIGILGLLLIFGYWWIYFENTDGSALKGLGGWWPVVWLYGHLPLVMSLTALGVGIGHLLSEGIAQPVETSTNALTTGALAVSFVAIGLTHVAVSRSKPESLNPLKARWRFATAFFVILVGLFVYIVQGSALLLIVLLSLVSFVQVLGELFVLKEGQVSGLEVVEEL